MAKNTASAGDKAVTPGQHTGGRTYGTRGSYPVGNRGQANAEANPAGEMPGGR